MSNSQKIRRSNQERNLHFELIAHVQIPIGLEPIYHERQPATFRKYK